MDNQQPSNKRKITTKNARKHIINVGETYGLYKVIGLTTNERIVKATGRTYTETKYVCENILTHKISNKNGCTIHKAMLKYQEKSKVNHQLGLRKHLYRSKISGAHTRHIDFELTFEQFDNLISQNCVYCGAEPVLVSDKYMLARADMHQEKIAYNGIDRVDPTKGYIIDNCVPCCTTCNYMKRILQRDEFLDHVKKIYNFSIIKGSTTIPKGSTSQANGDGNGSPLTCKDEGEDIVSTNNV